MSAPPLRRARRSGKRGAREGTTSSRTCSASSRAAVVAPSKEAPSSRKHASLKTTMPVAALAAADSMTRTSATSTHEAAALQAQTTSEEKADEEWTAAICVTPLLASARYALA